MNPRTSPLIRAVLAAATIVSRPRFAGRRRRRRCPCACRQVQLSDEVLTQMTAQVPAQTPVAGAGAGPVHAEPVELNRQIASMMVRNALWL